MYVPGKQFLNLTSAAKKETVLSRMFAWRDVSMRRGVGGGGGEASFKKIRSKLPHFSASPNSLCDSTVFLGKFSKY